MLISHVTQLYEPDLLGRVDAASLLPLALALRIGALGVDISHRGAAIGAWTSRDGAVGVRLIVQEDCQLVGYSSSRKLGGFIFTLSPFFRASSVMLCFSCSG